VTGLLSQEGELESVTCMFFHSLYSNFELLYFFTFFKFPTMSSTHQIFFFLDARIIEVTQAHLTPRTPSPVKEEEDPVEEVVIEEPIVEEVPEGPVEDHITVSAAAATPAAPAAGFHFMQESELEATAEAEAPYDEQVQELPIPVVVEAEADTLDPLEACYFFFSSSLRWQTDDMSSPDSAIRNGYN